MILIRNDEQRRSPGVIRLQENPMAFLTGKALFRASLLAATVSWLAAGVPRMEAAAGETAKEYELKAVLVFNLVRFVDWPPQAFTGSNSNLVIGIMGRDPFGGALDQVVAGEVVNGHRIRIERCANLREAARCQLLFVSSSERSRAARIIEGLKGLPVLTVSDIDGFCKRDGGMICLYVNEENKVRVRINLEAAKAERLVISSKLLQVAELEKVGYSPLQPLRRGSLLARILTEWPEHRAGNRGRVALPGATRT